MLRLLADENFNGDIVRALLLRQPDLDIVRVQDVGLAGIGDPDTPVRDATFLPISRRAAKHSPRI